MYHVLLHLYILVPHLKSLILIKAYLVYFNQSIIVSLVQAEERVLIT